MKLINCIPETEILQEDWDRYIGTLGRHLPRSRKASAAYMFVCGRPPRVDGPVSVWMKNGKDGLQEQGHWVGYLQMPEYLWKPGLVFRIRTEFKRRQRKAESVPPAPAEPQKVTEPQQDTGAWGEVNGEAFAEQAPKTDTALDAYAYMFAKGARPTRPAPQPDLAGAINNLAGALWGLTAALQRKGA